MASGETSAYAVERIGQDAHCNVLSIGFDPAVKPPMDVLKRSPSMTNG